MRAADRRRRMPSAVVRVLGLMVSWPLAAVGQDQSAAERLARELAPRVEEVTGLRFRRPPRVVVRSRDQVRAYLNHRINEEYTPAEMRGIERAYHALGLVDDTIDVRRLLLDLLAEQVAGYYDPDSAALFVLRGADPLLLRPVLAHELVHALQDQHTRLNAVLKLRRDNDRRSAGHAVFEGQAVLAMIRVMNPGVSPEALDGLAGAMSAALAQPSTPVLARAPRFIVAGMLFPYSEGAAFMLAFEELRRSAAEQPFGERLPVSTEQILHPDRYAARDVPVGVTFPPPAPGDTVLHEDNFGEFELREALRAWGVAEDAAIAAAAGWDGDRFRVLGTRSGTVVQLAAAWDSDADAADFAARVRAGWATRAARFRDARARRFAVDRLTVAGAPVVRLIDAPAAWPGWSRLPAVAISR